MGDFEPYRDSRKPGRFDVNGVEWWACDPYPTWFRWEYGQLIEKGFENDIDGAPWAEEDPKVELRRALEAFGYALDIAQSELAQAKARVERAAEQMT